MKKTSIDIAKSTTMTRESRPPKFDRGFTGHEHLYDFGLINMNGRVYDPLMSAFLSPDNYMQDPTTQQGFNRYAYCLYNPLKYVDPSGERYFGYDEGAFYRMMEAMQQQVFHEMYSAYDMAVASVQLTINMACGLFSHGQDTQGNGSGYHGNPGGGSVEVKDLGNGKYEVVKGLYDGGNTVYIVDDQGNRTGILGYSLTPYTFYNEDGNVIDGSIIDMNDYSGQIFYDEINNNTPGEYYYAFGEENANGQNFGNYDFKAIGLPEGLSQKAIWQYYDRGMLFDYGNGLYIASARDIGNFVAGFVAGKNGVGFIVTRFGFDWYQGGIEPKVSRRAQNKGYFWGLRCFFGF